MYRILLIDDEKMALLSTQKSFSWEKYGIFHVFTTQNPYEALNILQTQRIDAAFVDIRMPEISGFDLIALCREQNIDTEFVIVTGYSDFSYAKQAFSQNAFDYVLKPIQPEDADPLLEKLTQRLFQKRLLNDPKLYQELLSIETAESALQFLGLPNNKIYWQAAQLKCCDQKILYRLSRKDGIFLRINENTIVCIYTGDYDQSDKIIEMFRDVLTGETAVFSEVQNTPSMIPTVLHKADYSLSNAEREGKVGIFRFSIDSTVNDSFLALLSYVNSHYLEELSLQELAEQYSLNYTYCSELFRKVMNCTFSQYVTDLRMEEACRMLKKRNRSIEEISYAIGYSSYHYFEKVFKKAFSMTPSQYRNS